MERDHSSAINEHKAVIKQLNKKTDASMEGMKQQHAGAIAKVFPFYISDLTQQDGSRKKMANIVWQARVRSRIYRLG